jgi:hypothetical protein
MTRVNDISTIKGVQVENIDACSAKEEGKGVKCFDVQCDSPWYCEEICFLGKDCQTSVVRRWKDNQMVIEIDAWASLDFRPT